MLRLTRTVAAGSEPGTVNNAMREVRTRLSARASAPERPHAHLHVVRVRVMPNGNATVITGTLDREPHPKSYPDHEIELVDT